MRRLATLLGQSESAVKKLVDGLEAKTGFASTDVSFLATHNQKVRRAVASLGLDPEDTTGPELYQALQARFKGDSDLFDKTLGIIEPLSSEEKVVNLQKLINLSVETAETWAIKPSTLKTLFREFPPIKTRKQLGYRTIESMLKRHNLGMVSYLGRLSESPTWQKKFNKALAKAVPNLYEMRPVKLVVSNELKAVKAEPITGTVLIGSSELDSHSLLSLSLAVVHELEKISRINAESLSKTAPTLHWWQKLEHLSAIKEDQAISFNIKDVAHNWQNKMSYYEQTSSHAAEQIMQNLLNAYKAKTRFATQEEEAADTQVPGVSQLAKEIVEV